MSGHEKSNYRVQFKVEVSKVMRKRLLLLFALLSLVMALGCVAAQTQDAATPHPEALMDKMIGNWLMTGTIDNKQITHDVNVDWILGNRYIRIHEASREKTSDGELDYEAWIHIAWDSKNSEYVVMWLDNTGTTNFAAEGVGHGKPNGNRIPFVWKSAAGGGIQNIFTYDVDTDTWSWVIDNIDDSEKPSSFARVTLERKVN